MKRKDTARILLIVIGIMIALIALFFAYSPVAIS